MADECNCTPAPSAYPRWVETSPNPAYERHLYDAYSSAVRAAMRRHPSGKGASDVADTR